MKPEYQQNWVVVVQTKKAKRHFYSIGVGSEEEAEMLASKEKLKLIRERKIGWYEVVIIPPNQT